MGALLLGVAGAALIAIEAWVLLLLGSFSAGLLFPTFAIALQIDGVWA